LCVCVCVCVCVTVLREYINFYIRIFHEIVRGGYIDTLDFYTLRDMEFGD